MRSYPRRFNKSRRSINQQAQFRSISSLRRPKHTPNPLGLCTRSGRVKENILTPKTQRIISLEQGVSALKTHISAFKSELYNVKRQLLRATATKKKLQVSLRQSWKKPKRKAAPTSSESESQAGGLDVESDHSPPPGCDNFPELTNLKMQVSRLQKDRISLRKRLLRSITGRGKAVERALHKAKCTSAVQYFLKNKGVINDETRSLIRALVEMRVPFGNVLDVIRRVLRAAGIQVIGNFTRRAVRRIVREGGVLATLQLGHEFKQASSMTISSDGTTHKSINVEAAFATIPTPSYDPEFDASVTPGNHSLRAFPIIVATGHTSQEQLDAWKSRLAMVRDVYNESPLARDSPLTETELLGKIKGFLSDHANDQKHLASLLRDWKHQVDREGRGQEYLTSLPPIEVFNFYLRVAEDCIQALGGPEKWQSLSEDQRRELQDLATQRAVLELGEARFDVLSMEDKRLADLFLWGGCAMHKVMNSEKWGAQLMEEWWSGEEAVQLGANKHAPIMLYNKANAATIADETASSSKDLAESSTKRGGVKTTDLAGGIFRHKYYKKGQQDNFRWYFAYILGYIIQFPDTSNTRFGSHGQAASELLVHRSIFTEFLDVVRSVKDAGVFNNMEKNLWEALHDPSTLSELAALALYSQTVTLPYLLHIRGSPQLNGLTLGPYHDRVIQHCQDIAENPDLLFNSSSDSYKSMSLGGKQWERPEVLYTIQQLEQNGQLPYLRNLVSAFFGGAVIGWKRFVTEFAPGSAVAEATPNELEAAHMRATNDPCEGSLGKYRQDKNRSPSKALATLNASAIHKQNNTEAWERHHLTKEVSKFVIWKARKDDTGAAVQQARVEHAQLQKDRAVEKEASRKARKVKRSARERVLEELVVHLEPEYWTNPSPDAKTTVKDINLHLSWLRLPSRNVKVPTGLSNLRRQALLQALVDILEGFDSTKTEELYATNVKERERLITSPPSGSGSSNPGEIEDGEEEKVLYSESDEDEY